MKDFCLWAILEESNES